MNDSACRPEPHRAPLAARSQRPNGSGAARLVADWATDDTQVAEAQRLRHEIFAVELGARLPGARLGLDMDVFDPYCDHLLLRTVDGTGTRGDVVGTYRVLMPHQARRLHPEHGLYSDSEFDLTRLRHLRGRMVELGRSCVHPEHRQGSAVLIMWRALANYMARHDMDTMIGCASVSMHDGGHAAASLWERLRHLHLAPIEYRCHPRLALPIAELDTGRSVDPPPLLSGYLRLGARLLGPPAWDPDFHTADFPLFLRLSDLQPRHRRHFGLG